MTHDEQYAMIFDDFSNIFIIDIKAYVISKCHIEFSGPPISISRNYI